MARNTKLDITDVKVEEITYVDDYGAEEKVRILKVKARVRTNSNKVGQIEKVGYNEVVKELEAFEKSIIKNKFESARVILPDGEIFELAGSSRNVDPTELGIDLTGAYITHNHPEGAHDFGFSKDDFSFFIANKLRLLRAVDEKYIHELTTDLFEMEFEDIDINDLVKLYTEKVAEQLQKQEALNRNLKYRRLKRDY